MNIYRDSDKNSNTGVLVRIVYTFQLGNPKKTDQTLQHTTLNRTS